MISEPAAAIAASKCVLARLFPTGLLDGSALRPKGFHPRQNERYLDPASAAFVALPRWRQAELVREAQYGAPDIAVPDVDEAHASA